MSKPCSQQNHVWLLDTACGMITPALDLIPGRRCDCGNYVIVPHTDHPQLSLCYAIAPIDSPAATRMIERHPALKTW